MGQSKAAVELCGRTLISHPIAALRLAGLAPFVVARADSELPQLDCPVVIEGDGVRHPLMGIIAALEHADAPVVVVACDLPALPPELLAELGHRRARFAMPVHPRPQPLVARYTPGLLPRLRAGLAAAEPLSEVAAGLGGDSLAGPELRGYGDPQIMFANANSPEDVRRLERLLR